jgi:hypothetical protein
VNTSYAPQYAFGKGYATVLNIANQETTAASVLLQLFDDNGLPFGVPGTVNLPGSGSARIDSPAIFGLSPGNSLIQGYVKLQSGSRFTGSVLFTDAQRIQFGSALHFVDRTLSTIYFSHVAQNSFYYTGLAAVNPNLQPATVLITVYGSNGVPVAAGSSQIPAGGRFSKVLTELVGAFPAMTRGYFKVASTQPLVAFALFGTHNGTVLSAIPPQYPTGK